MEKIRFKNDREVLEALLDNKKIGNNFWGDKDHICLKDGFLKNKDDFKNSVLSDPFSSYYLWQPPKKFIEGKEVYKFLVDGGKIKVDLRECSNVIFFFEKGIFYVKVDDCRQLAKTFLESLNVLINDGKSKFEEIDNND